jgi:hypothetical protein
MDNEEVGRAIEFLLKSQAQLTANVESLTASVGKLSGTVGKLSDKVDRTADSVIALLAIAEIHERGIGELREASRATDEKLNALILTVERYVSRRNGNGGARPEEK